MRPAGLGRLIFLPLTQYHQLDVKVYGDQDTSITSSWWYGICQSCFSKLGCGFVTALPFSSRASSRNRWVVPPKLLLKVLKQLLKRSMHISLHEVHLHGKTGPQSRRNRSTLTEEKSTLERGGPSALRRFICVKSRGNPIRLSTRHP